MRLSRIFGAVLFCVHALAPLYLIAGAAAWAQSADPGDPFTGREIESVRVEITNPSATPGLNERVIGDLSRRIGLYAGDRFSNERVNFALAQARRAGNIAKLDYAVEPGTRGGVVVIIKATLSEAAAAGGPRGALTGGGGFPLLYDNGKILLRGKLEGLALYYANNNAWFAQPEAMLAGNPLVTGKPAGAGWDDWIESYVHYGVNGMVSLTPNVYVYGAASAMVTASAGQELFTNKTRYYNGVEDAYAGIILGKRTSRGDRIGFDFNAGRQRFTLANGFLIANTAANGDERAALQANARWASDLLINARFFWNNLKVEGFLVEPDELPVINTHTQIVGANAEYRFAPGSTIGATWLTVPRSTFAYYSRFGLAGTRKGLELWDARFTWSPVPPGRTGPFFGGEFAQQTNKNFPMKATAGWGEIGYSFPTVKWTPTVSYRYAYFSGDSGSTAKFERWDPLLSGGSGEQWVQGANMFKVVQDSNSIAHRFQARFRVSPKIELVPQVWLFRAASKDNVGGNPALQFLSTHDYGSEYNVTFKYFASRRLYVHGHIAVTEPGSAIQDALGHKAKTWTSAMLFVRYAY